MNAELRVSLRPVCVYAQAEALLLFPGTARQGRYAEAVS